MCEQLCGTRYAAGAGVLLVALAAAGTILPGPAGARPAAARDIPPGYDFPAARAALEGLRDAGNVPGMRAHVWMVFAGLTQPADAGRPIWATWHYRDEVFADPTAGAALKKFDKPAQLELGHVLDVREALPSVDMSHALPVVNLYNEAAFRHVRDNQYHTRAALQAHVLPGAAAALKPFPPSAVVLKTIWWPVRKGELTPLPVWDDAPLNPPESGNGYTTFRRIVAIDPTRDAVPDGETTDAVRFHNPAKPDEYVPRQGSRVVSLARFFHVALTAADAADIGQAVGDKFAGWYGRPIQAGDYAILLGFHLTTREIPDWVWATFWWHDRPDAGPFAADRPGQVTGVWRNYLTTVAYSPELPEEADGSPHVAFNPYLEAPFANGTRSNCMACHRRAAWPLKKLGDDNPLVKPFEVTRGALPADPPMFKGRATTDFLWSLPLHGK